MFKTIIVSHCARNSSNLTKMTRCLATSCPHLTKASLNGNIDQKYVRVRLWLHFGYTFLTQEPKARK